MYYRRAAHVAWRRVGEETVVIHLKDKRIFVLNASGGFVWHLLTRSTSAGDVLARIGKEKAPPGAALESFGRFFQTLAEADLIEPDPSPETVGDASDAPSFPHPSFVAPELVWQDEIRNFGASCAFLPGAAGLCNQVPFS